MTHKSRRSRRDWSHRCHFVERYPSALVLRRGACSHCRGNLILSCLSSQTSEEGWNRTEINHEAWSGKAVNYLLVENGGTHGNRDESQRFNGTRSCSLLFILVMQHVYLFLSKQYVEESKSKAIKVKAFYNLKNVNFNLFSQPVVLIILKCTFLSLTSLCNKSKV